MKVKTSTVIQNTEVELIGRLAKIKFYRPTNCPYDDLCYVVDGDDVLGYIECGMSQGCGFISDIKELK